MLFLGTISFSIQAQESDIDPQVYNEIVDFVKEETKLFKELKRKKYFKNFLKDDFVLMFKEEPINRKEYIKSGKRYLKKRDNERMELVITTPFDEFLSEFNLYVLTKNDLEGSDSMSSIIQLLGDLPKEWNPEIEMTQDRYLICLLPNFDPSSDTVPRFGEFMIIQILQKNGERWKVYSSYN